MSPTQLKSAKKLSQKIKPVNSLIALWCLRMLIPCGGHRKFIDKYTVSSDAVLELLELEEFAEKDEIDRQALLAMMKAMLEEAERKHLKYPQTLTKNIEFILKRIPLNNVEMDILMFTVLLHTEQNLESCADTLGTLDKSKLIRHLATVLRHSQQEISRVLSANGMLAVSGLLKIDNSWSRDMRTKIDLMQGLADQLLTPEIEFERLFSSLFSQGPYPKNGPKAFIHVKESYDLIRSYLKVALEKRTAGVNILLYGLPGTGKTEMVRTLVQDANATLYEVSMSDADGDPLTGKQRFSAYQLCQQILRDSTNDAIMFDEIEDVFPDLDRTGGKGIEFSNKKAWINNLLENNPVPSFWVCNKVHQIDSAFLRRFDFVMEMPSPSSKMRDATLESYLEGMPVSGQWTRKMRDNENLLPAHIEKAAKVLRHVASSNAKKNEAVLDRVIRGTMNVLDHTTPNQKHQDDTVYDPDLVSAAAVDISRLIDGLKRSGSGNLCFYGPPGTGKTALGRHIAERLDRPLMLKRASDILSMWHGETEKNMARMFEAASRENAVLMLDEADSFLRDRRGAGRSYEVTHVNEMLVQMENFEGLFICSTNLMDQLDQASLRRFSLKVRFEYLTPDKAVAMLTNECVGKVSKAARQDIASMRTLTPGDFAAAKRRLHLLGEKLNAENIVRELKNEVEVKSPEAETKMGFIH